MKTRWLSSIACASVIGAFGLVLASCGGTDGGGAEFSGTQFVGTDGAIGTIDVNVLDTDMPVGETTGFGVAVRDSNGNPVPGIKVACDSELGVGIVEPITGIETTDSGGDISGVISCNISGSYQFGCRVAIGANKRELVDIKCRGTPGTSGSTGGGMGG